MASSVSVTVPIWLSLISAELPMSRAMARGDDGRVGAEVVVADQFGGAAQAGGERDPAVVVVLAEAVLDQVHRELRVMAAYRSIMSLLDSRSPATW